MLHSGASRSSLPYHLKIIITHIYLLSNSSNSRLALCFDNPIFTTSCITFIVHCCCVIGNAMIQRIRFLFHKFEKCNDKNQSFISLCKTRQILVLSTDIVRTIKLFPEPDLTLRILMEVTFSNFAA